MWQWCFAFQEVLTVKSKMMSYSKKLNKDKRNKYGHQNLYLFNIIFFLKNSFWELDIRNQSQEHCILGLVSYGSRSSYTGIYLAVKGWNTLVLLLFSTQGQLHSPLMILLLQKMTLVLFQNYRRILKVLGRI